jgi:hypothetical protein
VSLNMKKMEKALEKALEKMLVIGKPPKINVV